MTNHPDDAPPALQQITIHRTLTVAYSPLGVDRFVQEMNQAGLDLFGEGLDSMDGGDATGMAVKLHSYFQDNLGNYLWESEDEEFILTVTYEDDSFIWDPPHS
jgi:hypothetical protein